MDSSGHLEFGYLRSRKRLYTVIDGVNFDVKKYSMVDGVECKQFNDLEKDLEKEKHLQIHFPTMISWRVFSFVRRTTNIETTCNRYFDLYSPLIPNIG